MKTALDVALERCELLEPIPPITEPMGKNWKQPKRSEIQIDATHAMMTRTTFNELAEYSASQPSGVYEGKMWKRHDGGFDNRWRNQNLKGPEPVWLLVWFGRSEKPDYVSNNYRAIIIIEDGAPDEGCSCCVRPQRVPTPV